MNDYDYIKDSLDQIYGKDDNFIIIGLTGQTGSGCSTAANILSLDKDQINHSLYNGDSPLNNEQRKQKIIFKYFSKNWDKFNIIHGSAVITLLWALEFKYKRKGIDFLNEFFKNNKNILKNNKKILKNNNKILESNSNILKSNNKILRNNKSSLENNSNMLENNNSILKNNSRGC